MTCPNCKCQKCRTAAVNAVLVKHVARETTERTSTYHEVLSPEQHNAAAIRDNRERERWQDTFEPRVG